MSQPAKVLIVDDEKLTRLNLRALLEDLGYRVVEAADGLEGLDAFECEQPGLVLADLRMPGMDGLSMIAKLREKSPEDISHHLLQMEEHRKGIKGQYERRFRHKDGRTVWTILRSAPSSTSRECNYNDIQRLVELRGLVQ